MSFLSESNEIADKLRAQARTKRARVFDPPFILIRRDEVERGTGLSRSSIYAMMKPDNPLYDPTFPVPLRVGARAVAWRADEVTAWMNALPRANAKDMEEDE